MSLTKKQRIFIDEYLKCWNATEAARRAGYSEKTARAIGCENLTKPDIEAAIKKRLTESAMSAEEVLMRLAEQARGDHAKYTTSAGIDMKMLVNDGKAHLVKKYVKTPTGTTAEFYDAQAALTLLGKHHKLFTERHEITGEAGGPLIVKLLDDDE